MSEWKKCRKLPIELEFREVEPITKNVKFDIDHSIYDTRVGEWVLTHEGKLWADCEYDYIIKGIKGELYPIKKDIFNKIYEVL